MRPIPLTWKNKVFFITVRNCILVSVLPVKEFSNILFCLHLKKKKTLTKQEHWSLACDYNNTDFSFSELWCWAGHFKSGKIFVLRMSEHIPVLSYLPLQKTAFSLIATPWKSVQSLVISEPIDFSPRQDIYRRQKHKFHHIQLLITVFHYPRTIR